jgi:pimeloyl-ACP methyl ester carboxylesterase
MRPRILLSLALALGAAAGLGLFYLAMTGQTLAVLFALTGPQGGFEPTAQSPAPNYAEMSNWAALPQTQDLADQTPASVSPRSLAAHVDVFFIHPTGYIKASQWTSPMNPVSSTEDNTRWMLANQASVFNGCCEVYAPRYREGALKIFFGDRREKDIVLDFVYSDIDAAFTYFLDHFSKGRPFIIAGHSQGSSLAMRLIERRIDGTPLRERLVAAYLIGSPAGDVSDTRVSRLSSVGACESATELHCIIHFATYARGSQAALRVRTPEPMLCVNPLTWTRNAGASASFHLGAVASTGKFDLSPFGKDTSAQAAFRPLEQPEAGITGAECWNGVLLVSDISKQSVGMGLAMPGGNYHGLDYPLFYMNLRKNAIERVSAFIGKTPDRGEIGPEVRAH